MKYFVSSDIHGYFDLWQDALKEKGFDINNENHKIIVCGDLFDRGRQPKEIINFILKNPEKFILIRGNHEDLMDEMILRNSNTLADLSNGTAQTIIDLCPEWLITKFELDKIAKHTGLQEVLDMCIDYYETEHYVFVHGWIPTVDGTFLYDKDWRNASKVDWQMARWKRSYEMYVCKIFEPGKTIVSGHYTCSALWHETQPDKYDKFGKNEYFEPFISENVIGLDACTAYSKKVNVVVIED
ncbi:MAG: metallophosphoesterase [Clostridia bacterium]|nr:metallophosphoesterase [Clostridia bacterium]